MQPFLAGGVADVINHYLTLGLPEGAPMESVHRAYQKALHRFHQHQQAAQPLPEADFDALQNAYTELRDPERKAAYDRDLQEERVEAPSLPTEFSGPVQRNFAFTGTGGEYFRIWIVNLLLSILTLGIYSAWAKVRNLQYFYGNTSLNNSTFEYTAKPWQILKGRIIAMVLLIAYSLLSHFSPMMALVLLLVLIIATPWIVVLSLRFNARFTSYRNIAFRFDGSVSGAFVAYIVWPIVAMFSLGLLLPFAWRQQTQYIIGNHSYGDTPFKFDVNVGEYYKMLGILIGGSIVFFVVYFMVMGGGAMAMAGNPAAMAAAMIPMIALYLAFYLVVGAYMAVTMANIQFNNTTLSDPKSSAADHRFSANWQVLSYMKLLFINTLLILLTLGLFIPFAKVRTAAYKAEHTSFVATSDLDTFVAGEREQSNSLAEGVNDLFAMDISI